MSSERYFKSVNLFSGYVTTHPVPRTINYDLERHLTKSNWLEVKVLKDVIPLPTGFLLMFQICSAMYIVVDTCFFVDT